MRTFDPNPTGVQGEAMQLTENHHGLRIPPVEAQHRHERTANAAGIDHKHNPGRGRSLIGIGLLAQKLGRLQHGPQMGCVVDDAIKHNLGGAIVREK